MSDLSFTELEGYLPPWTQRQLASITTSALTLEQLPLLQSDQVILG